MPVELDLRSPDRASARSGRPAVTLAGIGHCFVPGHLLFDHLDGELTADQVYAVTGPSGTGKSTLLGILAGWIRPTHGVVTLRHIGSVQWVFQNPHGVATRTALDHVALPLIAQGMTRREADRSALALLGDFGLASVAGSPFGALSGGEAQRLMLARGMATNPDVLLVDEPTAQLDRHTAEEVNRSLGALAGRGVIVVIATHDPETASACTAIIDLADAAVGIAVRSVESPAGESSAGESPAGPTPPPAAACRRPTIRAREAARESWRNLATGSAPAAILALALFAITVLLGGLDAWSVRGIVDGAVAYQAEAGAVWVLDAPGLVNGVACDALGGAGGIVSAGALRQDQAGLVTSALPRTPVPLFAVTPGFARVVGVNSAAPGVGLWITDTVAARYGTDQSGVIATPAGAVPVDGGFSYPDDGRAGRLGFAALAPTPADDGRFDQCWLTIWPADDSSVVLARTALAPTGDAARLSEVKFYQLNPTVAASFDGLSEFAHRLSRLAAAVALVAAAALGAIAGWSRRLEHASALHAGLPQSFLLGEALIEAAAWALAGVLLSAPVILFIATGAQADNASVALAGVRPLAAGLAGALFGTAIAISTTRERQLFNLFKNR